MWGKQKLLEQQVTCSLVQAPGIFIEAKPRHKIGLLMEAYPHQEWLAYLVGRRGKADGVNIFVEDISVPPHANAGGASAEAEPFHIPEACVGMIHSHHHMGAFHSGTDQAYVDRNFPVSITVAFNGGGELVYDAVSYQETPCHKALMLKCTVKYVQPQPDFNCEAFLLEAKTNVEKGRQSYQNGWDNQRSTLTGEEYQQSYLQRIGKYWSVKDEDGKFIPKGKESEASNLLSKVVDHRGVVLTKDEIEDILANSEQGGGLGMEEEKELEMEELRHVRRILMGKIAFDCLNLKEKHGKAYCPKMGTIPLRQTLEGLTPRVCHYCLHYRD